MWKSLIASLAPQSVVWVSNRLADGATVHGYRDVLLLLTIDGHVCELQLLSPRFVLKVRPYSHKTRRAQHRCAVCERHSVSSVRVLVLRPWVAVTASSERAVLHLARLVELTAAQSTRCVDSAAPTPAPHICLSPGSTLRHSIPTPPDTARHPRHSDTPGLKQAGVGAQSAPAKGDGAREARR